MKQGYKIMHSKQNVKKSYSLFLMKQELEGKAKKCSHGKFKMVKHAIHS